MSNELKIMTIKRGIMALLIKSKEKEALLIMFGPMWQKKFQVLDGQYGRPNIAESIDSALLKLSPKSKIDIIRYLENHLKKIATKLEKSLKSSSRKMHINL